MARSRSGDTLRDPHGAARIGVLLFVLLVALGTYVAVSAGGVYIEYRKFKDQMTTNGHLAQSMDDLSILSELTKSATDLGLPPEAVHNIAIRRSTSTRSIRIESRYQRVIELPFVSWTLDLHPHVSVSF